MSALSPALSPFAVPNDEFRLARTSSSRVPSRGPDRAHFRDRSKARAGGGNWPSKWAKFVCWSGRGGARAGLANNNYLAFARLRCAPVACFRLNERDAVKNRKLVGLRGDAGCFRRDRLFPASGRGGSGRRSVRENGRRAR